MVAVSGLLLFRYGVQLGRLKIRFVQLQAPQSCSTREQGQHCEALYSGFLLSGSHGMPCLT